MYLPEPSVFFYSVSAFISLVWFATWILVASSLLFDKPQRKTLASYCVCATAVQVLMNHLSIYFQDILVNQYTDFYQTILFGAPMVWLLHRKRHTELLQTFSAVGLGYFLCQICYGFVVTNILMPFRPLLIESFEPPLRAFISAAICYVCTLLIGMGLSIFFRKVHFHKYWTTLFATTPRKMITSGFCLLLMYVHPVIMLIVPEWESNVAYSVVSMACMAGAILLILVLAIYNTNRDAFGAQKVAFQQQQAYVQMLEQIQDDVRGFRHDYQNMLAGLYLQAQQGDVAGLQEQLHKKLNYFDENLSEQIRRTSALANIRVVAVKSLLVVKMMEIQGKRIPFHMEVFHPVEQLGVDTEDFCRMLGILLDNAVEAAELAEKPYIDVTFVNMDATLQVSVRNTFGSDAPPLSMIWVDGFTTKGSGRGTGLATLKRIVNRYDNAMTHTSLSEGHFIQQLTIETGGAQ